MRWIKRVLSQMHRYVIVAFVSVFFWAWIFTLVTDAPAARKVMLYADVQRMEDRALAVELETELPDGIRMVQVHPFSYAAFDTGEPDRADLWIVPESRMETLVPQLCPCAPRDADDYTANGAVYGWRLSTPGGKGVAKAYISYAADEPYYLCFLAASEHLGTWNGSPDDAAIRVAEHLMRLP